MPTPRVLLLMVLVLTAAFSRLVPHPHNVAPIAAMTLFAAAHFPSRRWSILLPLSAMLLSDLVLYATKDTAYRAEAIPNMLQVFFAFCVVALIGQWLRQKVTVTRVISSSLLSSAVFFLITNFGSWMIMTDYYPRTVGGLMSCYVAGIPFFGNSIAGDLVYSGALFGGFALLVRAVPQFQPRLAEVRAN